MSLDESGSKIRGAAERLDDIDSRLEALETLIKRRFDEIATEINATSQQVDMAEEGFSRRFAEIFEVINAVSHQGEGKSQANAGVELEEVVNSTEDAANRIIDAADHISSYLKDDNVWHDAQSRRKTIEAIEEQVQNIMLACEFQDLTSQRIHKALEHLSQIEKHLGTTAQRMGIDVEDIKQRSEKAGAELVEDSAKASQDDIDKMFE